MDNRLRWNVLQLPLRSIVVSMTPGIYPTHTPQANPSCSGPIQHHHHHHRPPPHQIPARHHLTPIPKTTENAPQGRNKKKCASRHITATHPGATAPANAKYADAILLNQGWCRSSTAKTQICIGSRHRKKNTDYALWERIAGLLA